ncbi:MAG: HDOD domain-containing protein [Spirochaetales bacterium]|nr:HDOD domain-containing protein [Spirochaetales bacterium]
MELNSKDFAAYLNAMPVMPSVAAKVLQMAEDSRGLSFQQLEDAVSVDAGLTSKILRIANSALYARQKTVSQLSTAITLLGFNTIRSLVILVTGASLFNKTRQASFFKFFWKHSLITAFYAKDLTIWNGKSALAETAFTAALLHNIGQVALYMAKPSDYEKLLQDASRNDKRISELEASFFGITHKTIGATVLKNWSFPDIYCDVAGEHGFENIVSSHKTVVVLVSVADYLCSNIDIYKEKPIPLQAISSYMNYLGLSETRLLTWAQGFQKRLSDDRLYRECASLVDA